MNPTTTYTRVAQTPTPVDATQYLLGVIDDILGSYDRCEATLPDIASAHRRRNMAAMLARVEPTRYAGLARCGAMEVSCTPEGAYTLTAYHCNLKICPRCSRVNAVRKLQTHLKRLVSAVRAGHTITFVTLTQQDVAGEAPSDALERLRTSLSAFWGRVGSGTPRQPACAGALKSVEATCSGSAAYHFHAHLLWVGEPVSPDFILNVWARCSPGAMNVDARRIAADSSMADDEINRALLPFLTYLHKGVVTPRDPDNPEDLEAWAEAVVAVAGRRTLVAHGILHANTGKPKRVLNADDNSPAPPAAQHSDFDNEWEAQRDVPSVNLPRGVPTTLGGILAELRKVQKTGQVSCTTELLLGVASQLLGAYAEHCRLVSNSHRLRVLNLYRWPCPERTPAVAGHPP